jgi:thiamine-phosphate pyrophosphorylase
MSATVPVLADALRLVYVLGVEAARDWRHVEQVMEGGVTSLWLREPDATGADLYRAGKDLLGRCRPRNVALLVGDRADVAQALGAEGVHLGHRSPPANRIRPWYPGWLGMSCHSENDLKRAQETKADYAVLSPVYGVPEKGSPLGPALFARWVAGTTLPVVALGGIEATNAGSLAGSGAVGLAVVRALRNASDGTGAARALRAAMTRA